MAATWTRRLRPNHTQRKGRPADAPAVARRGEHGLPECDEPQRKDDEAGVEQRLERGLDAVPHQRERGLILRGRPGSLVEVGERGGRDVGKRSGREQGEPQDAQNGSEQRGRRACPAQRAVQPREWTDPQKEDGQVEAVLHRACRPDVREPRQRLLRSDVHPDERADDAEGDEHEDAGGPSPARAPVGLPLGEVSFLGTGSCIFGRLR